MKGGNNSFVAVAIVSAILISGLMVSVTSRGSEQERESDKDELLAVVQDYVTFSRAGQMDAISKLTIERPKSALKQEPTPPVQEKESVQPGVAVVTSTALQRDYPLAWVRKEFPKLIADDKKEIVRVDSIVIKDDFAKVAVNLGNEKRFSLLPDVFMLTKTESSGRWKIYDIKSPAYAIDYKP